MTVVRSFSYDVFLNFRGEDTRKTFTHKLYMALVQRGLSTFRDEDMMVKGENLNSELEKAICQSKSSIVVISKNYASSTWCLDELVLILEQRRTSRHIVLPVFYDVDPSHVRKQSGRIADAFSRYEELFEAETDSKQKRKLTEKIKGWRSALTEVSDLSGLDLQNHAEGHESKFIKEITKIISDKLIQSMVVLKIRLHCERCISKIKKSVSKINGVEEVTVDPGKDLVMVGGRVDVKELVLCLKHKLKRNAEVIPPANKDDKGGENKDKEDEKGGDKNDKDSRGDKKEKECSIGGGKKEKYKLEYSEYNPNTNTMPVYHLSDKKEKESCGGGGKKENKMEYCGYNPNTHAMPVYHQSEKKEKESGSGGGGRKMEYHGYNPNTHAMPVYHQSEKKEKESGSGGGGGRKKESKMEYHGYNPNKNTMPVYHQSDKKEKESGARGGQKESKMEYHGYCPNTYTMPMYDQSYAVLDYTGPSHHYSQNYSDHGYTVEYSHPPSRGEPSYYYHAMFSDDNPNSCSIM